MVVALVTAGVGVVGLVALVAAVTAPVRRFTRASAALRTDVARRLVPLRALRPRWGRPAGRRTLR